MQVNMTHLKLITLHSNYAFYEDRVLLPEMLFLFKSTCCWMKDDDITCRRIPDDPPDLSDTACLRTGMYI